MAQKMKEKTVRTNWPPKNIEISVFRWYRSTNQTVFFLKPPKSSGGNPPILRSHWLFCCVVCFRVGAEKVSFFFRRSGKSCCFLGVWVFGRAFACDYSYNFCIIHCGRTFGAGFGLVSLFFLCLLTLSFIFDFFFYFFVMHCLFVLFLLMLLPFLLFCVCNYTFFYYFCCISLNVFSVAVCLPLTWIVPLLRYLSRLTPQTG